jgi:hypothetical protein
VISHTALAKEAGAHATVEERLAAIERAASDRPQLRARSSHLQLIVDLADGYDVCVVGADKWHQLVDPSFYGGSAAARDDALARLPLLAVAPRRGAVTPPPRPGVVLLEIPEELHGVSSTAVRAGREDWRAGVARER